MNPGWASMFLLNWLSGLGHLSSDLALELHLRDIPGMQLHWIWDWIQVILGLLNLRRRSGINLKVSGLNFTSKEPWNPFLYSESHNGLKCKWVPARHKLSSQLSFGFKITLVSRELHDWDMRAQNPPNFIEDSFQILHYSLLNLSSF